MTELNRKNYGKMTWHEKKLNRLDLDSYKNKDAHTVHSMIPGINGIDSVGTVPFKKGAISVEEHEFNRDDLMANT